jgi:D-alanine-D-alanine ligase
MKVAVVYNRDSQDVINLFGQPNQEKIGLKVIRRIADGLKQAGHQVIALEADKNLIDRLEEFMPRVVMGERPGMVFNVSYGIQGQARYTHVPSILEMVGIPYVASGPLAHTIALDKVVTKMVLKQHGIPTPDFAVLCGPDFPAPELQYPLIVKPKNEAVSFGIRVVNDEGELREAAQVIFDKFDQAVLCERFMEGREVNVGLLGNSPPQALPPVELDFGDGPTVYSYEDKTGRSGRKISLVCPAPIGDELTQRAQDLAKRAFQAVGCSDCARVDFRLTPEGELTILEINSLPAMGPRGSYVYAAAEAGLGFEDLVARLVEVASARYFGTPTPPAAGEKGDDPKRRVFTFLTERRDRMERRVREWTKRASRTDDPAGPIGAARQLERTLEDIGLQPNEELNEGHSMFAWETPAGLEGGTALVVHLDVPVASDMATQGFRREPEWLHGDGIGSCKAPLVTLEYALRALRHVRVLRKRKIGVIAYLDEGRNCSQSSGALRKALAVARRVLVLRPGRFPSYVHTRRRGVRRYRLVVEGTHGRPGRPRKRPEALLWLAERMPAIAAIGSREERLSVSVVDLDTTAFPLMLPHRVTATLLMSYAKAERADEAEEELRRALGRGGPKWTIEQLWDRPPMPESRASQQLFRDLSAVGKEWNIPVKAESSVWPSVAGLAPKDTAVLCGLGPIAKDLYTPEEAVQRLSLVQRTLLLAQFLLSLEG